ncbi:type II toxin-antitoxin system HicA family toxin [uncultured Thiohalocapsa sp.]|mgnify:FL=1|jgi:predicted RNA binding protein YcfA (HicA-like mRNA interferase family)|uniref:type II toxin-antitoxin system HicA family toxin n=1 Tax=uncultured Thiohalocapsa sp. TaxID=768990 RepID=UPI0025E38973|nr:type II toxin-antitoxin system HicA family toxin [uncultured Thiohalocapsa sp.]
MKKRKLLLKLLSGSRNVRFSEAVAIAEAFGFRLDRVNGSHHIFVHPKIPELLNLQDLKGKAKPYQVKQLLQLAEIHNLQLEDES